MWEKIFMFKFRIVDWLAGLAVLCLAGYYYLTWNVDYWKRKRVRGPRPYLFYGNFKGFMLKKMSIGEELKKIYDNFPDESMIGIFERNTPALMLRDPNLIKDVLTKDFNAFSDRGQIICERVEPLSQHLFNLEPARWRPLRSKLAPIFTSGKLKEMFCLMLECADHFEKFVEKSLQNGEVMEIREIAAKFSTHITGACAFGLKMNSLSKEESEFCRIGRTIFEISWWTEIKARIREIMPWFFSLLKPIFYEYERNGFFLNRMEKIVKLRKETCERRNDFVDLLMDIQASSRNHSDINDIEITHELMTAQAFAFFAAGLETSSSIMSNALYELALNPSMQTKLRNEILDEINKNDGKLKYESIESMKYLHQVFNESARKYPPILTLTRRSTTSYTFRDTKITIPQGMKIFIPVYAIHRDPNIYPNPEVFDPERFWEENAATRHPSHFLPFGDGPRNCTGACFGTHQSKIGIITILRNFELDVCDKTQIPLKQAPTFLFAPSKGIYLRVKKIHR